MARAHAGDVMILDASLWVKYEYAENCYPFVFGSQMGSLVFQSLLVIPSCDERAFSEITSPCQR